jgi:hypothetical protein
LTLSRAEADEVATAVAKALRDRVSRAPSGGRMPAHNSPVLDAAWDQPPSMADLLEAVMEWHFNPRTGSRYWLERAKSLDFDPRKDVRSEANLALFPNVIDELRNVRVEDLVPRGYGTDRFPFDVYESGGATGSPKRIGWLPDLHEQAISWLDRCLDEHKVPSGVNWLTIGPSGPHIFGDSSRALAHRRGGNRFTVDLDPRWVRRCAAEGRFDETKRYLEHIIDQTEWILQSQDIGVAFTTPPLLEAMAGNHRVADLIASKVKTIIWGGASMDLDTRHLFRTEVFPGIQLLGFYGSTMVGGGMFERPGLGDEEPPTFDPPHPFITMSVVDPETRQQVPYGQRGQLMMSHLSRSLLLPNNLERDTAIRRPPAHGAIGDAIADIKPVPTFGGNTVGEGVY